MFAGLTFFLRSQIVGFYTEDASTRKTTTNLMWLACLLTLTMPFLMTIRGILQAAQKTVHLFLINFVLNFLLYSLFIWIMATEVDDRNKGLLYAFLITNGVAIIVYLVIVSLINWHEQSTICVQGQNHHLMLDR